MEYLIIWHLSSPVGARLNKVYCARIWNWCSVLWIWIFSYMDRRMYFHVLCNSMQTNPSSSDTTANTTHPKKYNESKIYSFPKVELFQLARHTNI